MHDSEHDATGEKVKSEEQPEEPTALREEEAERQKAYWDGRE